jgi:hypothetical protein
MSSCRRESNPDSIAIDDRCRVLARETRAGRPGKGGRRHKDEVNRFETTGSGSNENSLCCYGPRCSGNPLNRPSRSRPSPVVLAVSTREASRSSLSGTRGKETWSLSEIPAYEPRGRILKAPYGVLRRDGTRARTHRSRGVARGGTDARARRGSRLNGRCTGRRGSRCSSLFDSRRSKRLWSSRSSL